MACPQRAATARAGLLGPLGPLGLAVAVAALLLAVSARYGYHRDELYFIAIGGHPAWGYVDQPPLVPLLAHAMDVVGGHHLTILRLPSALAAAAIVYLTGLIAREFGAGPRGQLFAAGCMAMSGVLLAVGHLMSTTTYDLLSWTLLSLLVTRALRTDGAVWLAVGLVAGIALQIKTLPAFFLLGLLVGVTVCGPRAALRSRWLWGGAALALLIWLPNLLWQAGHHWPQFELAKAIANGSSGTSSSPWLLLPMQFLIVGPPLAPVWLTGLIRLARGTPWRYFAVTWLVLVVVFLATGGKPYYLAGLYPVLFAAGAEPVLAWLRTRARRIGYGVVLAVGLVIDAVVVLPIVPASLLHATPIVALNYDAGETVGWPRFATTIATAVREAGPGTVVLTGNYGEAGAVRFYRPGIPVYGSQNSMWDLAGPPADTERAVVVGFTPSQLRSWFTSVRVVTRVDNGLHVDDDEQGQAVYLCRGPRGSWPQVWREMRHLG